MPRRRKSFILNDLQIKLTEQKETADSFENLRSYDGDRSVTIDGSPTGGSAPLGLASSI